MKFHYFVEKWGDGSDREAKVKDGVVRMWETEFKEEQYSGIAHAVPDPGSGKCRQTHGGLY